MLVAGSAQNCCGSVEPQSLPFLKTSTGVLSGDSGGTLGGGALGGAIGAASAGDRPSVTE